MPEGDTLFRTAAGLRPYLVGRTVSAARTNGPGPVPQVERIVGREITAVDALGKNLLIRFDNGLEIRTHLRMNGSWHRYRPGERWRRPPSRARLVIEVPGAVAVCFDAPVVELLEQRAEALHPSLGELGPDLLAPDFDADEAIRRLRDPARAATAIGEALVDQRALAGIGNVYKNEVLWIERVSPFAAVGDCPTTPSPGSSRPPAGCCSPTSRPAAAPSASRRPAIGARRARSTSTAGPAGRAAAAGRRSPAAPGPRHPAHDLLVPDLPGSRTMSEIDVRCEVVADGWRCRVDVSDARGASAYEVGIPGAGPFLSSMLPEPGFDDMERLVRETFEFLLEREPRTSILARFDLAVVERYFPEYPAEMRRRLSR